jgi:hypothetical protein
MTAAGPGATLPLGAGSSFPPAPAAQSVGRSPRGARGDPPPGFLGASGYKLGTDDPVLS